MNDADLRLFVGHLQTTGMLGEEAFLTYWFSTTEAEAFRNMTRERILRIARDAFSTGFEAGRRFTPPEPPLGGSRAPEDIRKRSGGTPVTHETLAESRRLLGLSEIDPTAKAPERLAVYQGDPDKWILPWLAGEYRFVATSALLPRLQLLRDVLLSDLSTSDQKAPQCSLLELDAILEEIS